jgi:hypothetical protein
MDNIADINRRFADPQVMIVHLAASGVIGRGHIYAHCTALNTRKATVIRGIQGMSSLPRRPGR